MMPITARRKWLAPLLIFVVLVAVLAAISGIALGETSTTLSPSATGLPADVGTPSAGEADSFKTFTLKASELGDFGSEPPSVKSPSAIVINASTGKVLYERKADVQRPMASTTKIMTGILVLESLRLDQEVVVSEKAAATPEPKALLRKGDKLTVEQLLYALMIRSSNGAAVALAEAVSGSVEDFAERMNAKAQELGMNDTNFVNPNGLDADGHYSTAADMAKVARYAMKNETFREFANTRTYSLEIPGRKAPIELKNTNKLLQQGDWIIGVKTGLTPRADQCLVAAGTKNGLTVISVILGQPTTQVCWNESKALLEFGLDQFRHVTFLEKGTTVAQAPVPYEAEGFVHLVTAAPVEADLYKDDEVTTSVKLDEAPELPIEAGDKLGEVVLSVKGKTVGSVDLVADRSYDGTTLGGKIAYYWGRFTGWFGG